MKKKLIIFAGIVVVLFGGLWAYVRSDDCSLRIRPLVAGPLEQALGPGARVGRVRANLFPLYLEVRDIAVPGGGNAAAIAVRRIRVYLNPLPLIYRTVAISSVMIQEPRVEVRRSKEGVVDMQEVVERVRSNLASKSTGSGPAASIRVRSINVRNAVIRVHDDGTGGKATINGLSLKSSLSSEGEIGLRVTSGAVALMVPDHPELKMSLRASASVRQARVDVGTVELYSDTSRFTASGSLDLKTGDVRMNGAVTAGTGKPLGRLFKKKAKQLQGRLDAEWTVGGTTSDPAVEIVARCADVPMGEFTVNKASLRLSFRNRTAAISGDGWELSRGERSLAVRGLSAHLGISKDGVDVIDAAITTSDASVSLSGRAGVAEGYRMAFIIRSMGTGSTLAVLTGVNLDGPVSVQGTLTGKFADPEVEGTVTAGPMHVRNVLFQNISGMIRLRKGMLSLEGISIRQDSSKYLMDGTVDLSDPEPRYHARLSVIKSDVVGIVALFYKRIPLDLSATGEIRFDGTKKEFTGHGRLEFAAGVAYGEPFDRGTLIVDLSSTRVTFTDITLIKRDGSITGKGWIGFDGTYEAQVTSTDVDLSEVKHLDGLNVAGPFTLDIRSGGSFSRPTVHAEATAEAFLFREAYFGKAACTLDIVDSRMMITAGLKGESGNLASVQGTMLLAQQYPWSLRTTIDARDIGPAGMTGVGELWDKLSFSAQGHGDIHGEGGRLENINGNLIFSRFELNQGDYRIANAGDLVLRLEKGRFIVRSLHFAGTNTELTVSGSAFPGKNIDLLFSGDANLSLFRLFYREVEHADGTAGLTVRIREEWSNPDVAGELTITNGQVKIRDVPQKFTAVNGVLNFDRSRIVTEGFTAEVGGGAIAASGSAQIDGAALQDFTAKVVIQGVTVRYPQGLTAVVGGTLYLEGDLASRMLSGEMIVNRARYEKRVDWKSMLVDVRKGFTQKKKADIGWIGETQLNIRFSGKESILFESNLAKIPLEVDMLFRGTVNQPQVLGRIEARKGEVYFRKNVFRILYASADFADPNRINPLLDVQAETRVREYQVRLSVSGTADRSVVTFVSDPPLTDSNILALLTLGRTGEQLK
ncbi:MAG: translocation/assembly module TamB domain-containing protein, partial [Nitrospirota bacterium]|nr:translocation/assembly module TamB domain-containing protein [Nitrospirota bacterium]